MAKTLYNRFVRWNNIFNTLAENAQDTSPQMIDATYLKAHRTAESLRKRGFFTIYRTNKRRFELRVAYDL